MFVQGIPFTLVNAPAISTLLSPCTARAITFPLAPAKPFKKVWSVMISIEPRNSTAAEPARDRLKFSTNENLPIRLNRNRTHRRVKTSTIHKRSIHITSLRQAHRELLLHAGHTPFRILHHHPITSLLREFRVREHDLIVRRPDNRNRILVPLVGQRCSPVRDHAK